MQEVFAQAGQIKSFRLVTDKETGKLKGYGFCEYYEQAAAEIAVQNINQREVSGRQLRVDFAEDNMKGDDRDREGRRGPPPAHFREPRGGPGSKPVGAAAASSAAATMASMLGGPPGPGPTQEHVNAVLGGMSAQQLYDLMQQMRTMITTSPAQARHILISNPQLTKALFQAQILLGMVKPPPPPQGAPMPGPGPAGPPGAGPPPAHMGGPPPPYQPAPGPAPMPQGPPVMVAGGPPPGQYGAPQPGQYGAPPPQPMQQAPAGYGQPPAQPQVMVDAYGRPLQAGGPPMMAQAPPQPQMMQAQPPPQHNMAAILAAVPPEQHALVQQVLSLSEEQISALPEGARVQVMQVKQLLVSQGVMPR